jgi:hypothetical protein
VVDLALKLNSAGDPLARYDKDQSELIAARAFSAYQALGGRRMTLAAWRAWARQIVEEGRERG